ncbi:MAG: cytidylate kinase-like family protein [Deltaproteobacteria bacterium]|nr:cytidylate kinase-like family protein [Deltaproteobacteria bacterium]
MAIITISRGSFSHGKEIAEKVARKLGYACISREILLEAAQYFHVSERALLKSIHDAPSLLDRITHGRLKYIAYFRAALLDHVREDNVVYHGHAGHLLIPEVPHVFKARVIADMAMRIAFLQEKKNMSREEATAFLAEEDKQRAIWTRYLYKVDLEDPRLYNIILNIGGLTIDDACGIICGAVQSDTFKTTPESQRIIGDLAVVSHVKAALQDICDADVSSTDGMVHIRVSAQKIRRTGYISPKHQMNLKENIKEDIQSEIIQIVKMVPGVREVFCDVETPYYA